MTREQLTERLLDMFPEWSFAEAKYHAATIQAYTEQISFQLDVERTIDALPLTTEREAAA